MNTIRFSLLIFIFLLSSCCNNPTKSTPAIKFIPCEAVKPIYLPEVVDKQLEKDVIDFDIAYDRSCL